MKKNIIYLDQSNFIPIACGLLESINISMNPMLAGLAMTLSSFTVIVNALSLKRWKEK